MVLMTPVSLKLLLLRPSVHTMCHSTLSLHPSCNWGGDLFFRVPPTWQSAHRYCFKTNTRPIRFTDACVLRAASPPFLSEHPSPPFLCSLFSPVLFSPIMTACAIIITRLTELNRVQASYCTLKKFNPSINCV